MCTISENESKLLKKKKKKKKSFEKPQLSMKFVMLHVINLKLLTTAIVFLQNMAEHETFSANKYENANFCWHFHIY